MDSTQLQAFGLQLLLLVCSFKGAAAASQSIRNARSFNLIAEHLETVQHYQDRLQCLQCVHNH
jgi:hypothetical protein